MRKLYHVSHIANLDILVPHTSTHGKPYVDATECLELALLFGSNKSYGDYDGIYGIKDGQVYFYEAYKDAFKRRFYSESCYIYEVDPSTFEYGKTNFSSEVVSESPVKVLKCTKVDNLYDLLLSLIQQNKIIFKPFSPDKEYQEMIEKHIKERILRYGVLNSKDSNAYKLCKDKFAQYLNDLESEKS